MDAPAIIARIAAYHEVLDGIIHQSWNWLRRSTPSEVLAAMHREERAGLMHSYFRVQARLLQVARPTEFKLVEEPSGLDILEFVVGGDARDRFGLRMSIFDARRFRVSRNNTAQTRRCYRQEMLIDVDQPLTMATLGYTVENDETVGNVARGVLGRTFVLLERDPADEGQRPSIEVIACLRDHGARNDLTSVEVKTHPASASPPKAKLRVKAVLQLDKESLSAESEPRLF